MSTRPIAPVRIGDGQERLNDAHEAYAREKLKTLSVV